MLRYANVEAIAMRFSSYKLPGMLFMVIERFRDGNTKAVGERFARNGRMMPDDIEYRASWLDQAGTRCFQIVEAPHQDLLRTWINRWDDLVEFEVVPVVTSSEFWSKPR